MEDFLLEYFNKEQAYPYKLRNYHDILEYIYVICSGLGMNL